MSEKISDKNFVDDVAEVDGLKNEGPTWPDKNESLFVDLMVEEVLKGNRPTTTFTKSSWKYMQNQLNTRTGYAYTRDQLRNKFHKCRQTYKDYEKLVSGLTGHGWDPLLGTITLEEEQWDDLFKIRTEDFPIVWNPHLLMWEIIHIPDKPPISPHQQPTVNVFAAVVDPKLVNTLVRRLNQVAPLENLRHVKRVQKKQLQDGNTQIALILCLASENNHHLDTMPLDVQQLVSSYQLSEFIAKVCKEAALSKEEWEEQCKLWPTSYHPPTYNIDGITGFNEEDAKSVFSFMSLAIKLAKSCSKSVVNAAVIVDPSVKQVIASACDDMYSENASMCNASMEMGHKKQLESTGSHHGSDGATVHETLPSNGPLKVLKQSCPDVSCLYPWRWVEQQLHSSNSCHWHPLKHAAIAAIESSAARDKLLFPDSGTVGHKSIEIEHMESPFKNCQAKRQKIDIENGKSNDKRGADIEDICSKSARPYLCTGYDIYLVWEPCIMCAMALVHQRVRRIFYAFPNPNDGALGSVHRLQGEKSLNHHYAVFRVLLPDESEGVHNYC